jgi:hypothetical protein
VKHFVTDVRVGESVAITGSQRAVVTLEAKSGGIARLRFSLDEGASVRKTETATIPSFFARQGLPPR